MADFLLELLSEEIPARMQEKARADLARLFEAEIAAAGLKAEAIETFATPRRLALVARGLPELTQAVSEELKGPRTSAPPQALEGFLRKTGLTQDQLTERDGVYFAQIDKPGRATAAVLAEAIPAIVRAFPWPKSMRWGVASASTESLRWVRPLHGIVALLGEEIVECGIAGVRSGAATVGHRFHHPGVITIGGAHDYVEKLRACHVIVDAEERKAIIRDGTKAAAEAAGLRLIADEALVAENAGLTEWPVPLVGRFDPAFLDVPPEIIQLTARVNQKYFVCESPNGALSDTFVCIANLDAADGGERIVEGNRKVLAARLADARFFWEQDLKAPLEEQAAKLGQIVFHEKLGTVVDKVERVARLAGWLVEEGIVAPAKAGASGREDAEANPAEIPAFAGMTLADMAERAARLAKADLVTGLVGEFPELQGVIGGHLARAQGEPDEIADAIRDQYKPVGQGDEVPAAAVTVAVSLADKIDTIVGFFGIDEKPTGSRDPFALRRAALGVIELVIANRLRIELDYLTARCVNRYVREWDGDEHEAVIERLKERFGDHIYLDVPRFIFDRLKVRQREQGVRHDYIDACATDEVDLVRLLARVKALQAFVETAEGADLLAGYKRAANILKKEDWTPSEQTEQGGNKRLSYTPEKEEAALIAALDSAEPAARAAVEAEDFEGAMRALASLRAPVDAFFDKVTVNDADPDKRVARLGLLSRMRDAVHRVADFSKIEG